MFKLSQLIPLNYQEEKAKFFADKTYNPQFTYADAVDESHLQRYGIPDDHLVENAERLINEFLPYHQIQLNERQSEVHLSQDVIEKTTQAYLIRQGIVDRYQIQWSQKAIARCSIKSHQIIFRTGADYTKESLEGVLNHEIGTHALRRINDEQQPWHNKKKKFGFENSLLTEEGLATIQQRLDDELPVLYGAAVKYFAVYIAQNESFAHVFAELAKYFLIEENIWNTVFRVKRGLADTSKSGGFTKDMVYFEGAYAVAHWLRQHDFEVNDLYLGRISINDITKAKTVAGVHEPVLPFFVTDNPAQYKEKLTRLITENELVS